MNTNDQYLKTALESAQKAGKIFKQSFGRPKDIQAKKGNKRDLVTEIDLRIERLIRKEINNKFPQHKIIGEELGWDKIGQDDLFWIIDPIDGTTNFIQGVPVCCISIALWDKEGPRVSVVFNPIINQLYSAIKNKGAFLNNKQIKVSKTNKLIDSFGGLGWGRDLTLGSRLIPYFLTYTKKARILGSAAWEACEVASGNFDYYVHGSINIWDIAAAALIIKEAGGKISDWQNKALDPNTKQFIASNGQLHRELFKKIKNI